LSKCHHILYILHYFEGDIAEYLPGVTEKPWSVLSPNDEGIRCENLENFSQSQIVHAFGTFSYNTFRGVNKKTSRLSSVSSQLTETGGDDCVDVIYGTVDNSL
jgi:hypothetical protein